MPRRPIKMTMRAYPAKRTNRKKTFVAKRKFQRKQLSTIRNRNSNELIAPRFITTLKYCDRDTVPASVGNAAGADLYNLNSIYDPDRTGVGHQPLGRDQLALLYNRYRVFAVSWRVTFYPVSANFYSLFSVFPQNNANTNIGLSSSQLKELPHAFTKVSSIDKPTVFTGRVSLPRLTGQTSTQFKSGLEYQASFGADPSELQTLVIAAVPLSSGTVSYPYEIELKYHVECFDPIPLSQS